MEFIKCPCGNDYCHINRDEHFRSDRHAEYVEWIEYLLGTF